MPRPEKETLGQYVARIIREKELKHHEVKELSGGRITDGYVRGIMTGKAKNLSVDKLKALALGLCVSEDELFMVARGLPPEGDAKSQTESNYRMIFKLMSASLKNRTLTELLSEVARLSPESHPPALRALKNLNSRNRRSTRSAKKR